jgi:hypothetical protein
MLKADILAMFVNFSRKAFHVSLLSMMITVGSFVDALDQVEEDPFILQCVQGFYPVCL